MQINKQPILLYDYERDGNIKPGEAILIFEDGKTRRVLESSLHEKEINDRTKPIIQRPNLIRSRPAREVKLRKANPRCAPKRKRTALYKT